MIVRVELLCTFGSILLKRVCLELLCVTLFSLVPAPSMVTVTPPSGVIIAGSSPTLTCTVELSPAVDVQVTVNTVWTGPDGVTLTPTNPVMESPARYTSTVMVNAARSGDYTCQATVSSSSQFVTGSGMMSGTTTITVGKNTTFEIGHYYNVGDKKASMYDCTSHDVLVSLL